MNEILKEVKRLSKSANAGWEYLDGPKEIDDFGEKELERLLSDFDDALGIIRAFLVAYPQKEETK